MSGALIFGKMPSHGDFLCRGFAVDAREALDHWLSAQMADARAALGEAFEDRFDSAPPWRFAWAGDGWTAGALASSVDSAGRRFPLLVARGGLEAAALEPVGAACEDAIYDAFANRWTIDALAEAVDAIAPGEGDSRPGEGWWTDGNDDFAPAALPGREPPRLLLTMLGGPERAAA